MPPLPDYVYKAIIHGVAEASVALGELHYTRYYDQTSRRHPDEPRDRGEVCIHHILASSALYRSVDAFRMPSTLFLKLLGELQATGALQNSPNGSAKQKLGIFLCWNNGV